MLRILIACLAGVALLGRATPAPAQCEPGVGAGWTEGVFCVPGVWGAIETGVVWDDGNGEALYVGGSMNNRLAGCQRLVGSGVLRWDGGEWATVGQIGHVSHMAAGEVGSDSEQLFTVSCDDSSGQWLTYASRWDAGEQRWIVLGGQPIAASSCERYRRVDDVAFFDDGSGPCLYVTGELNVPGTTEEATMLRWDGEAWAAVDSLEGSDVYLVVYDDGGGDSLYAIGGLRLQPGGTPAYIAALRDGAWRMVDLGFYPKSYSLIASGDAMYGVQRVDGGQDHAVYRYRDGVASEIGRANAIVTVWLLDGPGGPSLYAMGRHLDTIDGVESETIARWDGADWHTLDGGLYMQPSASHSGVPSDLVAFDAGAGTRLLTVGTFMKMEGSDRYMEGIAAWDGAAWSPIHGSSVSDDVRAMLPFDDGSGTKLFVGGRFRYADGERAAGVARWDGHSWLPAGSAIAYGTVEELAAYESDAGAVLYAAGRVTLADGSTAVLLRWNGTDWETVPDGPQGYNALALETVIEDGRPVLYVGGTRDVGVMRWDGSAWTRLEGELSGEAIAIEVAPDGTLYVGGRNTIVRREHGAWVTLGPGARGLVNSLRWFDDGSGGALFATGTLQINETSIETVARWDGQQWLPAGIVRGQGHRLEVLEIGGRERLLLLGHTWRSGDMPLRGVAVWNLDLQDWERLHPDMNGPWDVRAAAVFDGGRSLYLGGDFDEAEYLGAVSRHMALWDLCACPADLEVDGALTIFDFLAFGNLFDLMDPAADFDGDGDFTIFDFLAFQNAFDAGCP